MIASSDRTSMIGSDCTANVFVGDLDTRACWVVQLHINRHGKARRSVRIEVGLAANIPIRSV